MNDTAIKGSCLCGSVTFAVTPPFSAFRYCHCSRCRKASGSAHAANLVLPRNRFEWITGGTSVKRFDLPGTERFSLWTCNHCGGRVPHEMRTTENVLVPAGLMDDDPGVRPRHCNFWGSKALWYVEPQQMEIFSEYPT